MKILHLLSTTSLSGAENLAADICVMFRNEIEMAYCSPRGEINTTLQKRSIINFSIRSLNPLEIYKVIKKYKPNIIHAHDVKATVAALLSGSNVPIVSHIHGNSLKMRTVSLKSFLFLLATRFTKHVIFVSNSSFEQYRFRRFLKQVTILPNVICPIRVEEGKTIDCNNYEFDFIFVGRLSYEKDPMRVARIANQVLQRNNNLTFGIVGDGPMKTDMQDYFLSTGAMKQVFFTGKLEYPYNTIQSSKCLLLASIFEGLPLVALEAMCLGVPIVSTPVDGLDSLILNNVSGFLRSSDDDLAEAVLSLINDSDLKEMISRNVLMRFKETNNVEGYKENLRFIYQSCIY